jgi:hypothetical protein
VPTPTATPTATPTESASPCVELAVNGDFETDEGWEIANTPHKARYTGAVAYSGSRSMQLGIDNPAENAFSYSSAEQRLVIPGGRTATLRFWYNVADGGGDGDYGYFLIRPDGGAWRVLRILRDSTDGWRELAVDVSHYAGSAFTLRLGMRNDGAADGAAGVMYVDELSLEGCISPSSLP